MTAVNKPDINGIPEIESFKQNLRIIDPAVKEVFLRYRIQVGQTDEEVKSRLTAIITHLTTTCDAESTADATRTQCSNILKNYSNFLKKYNEGRLWGGRRNTTKERKQKHNKNHRSRKLKSRKAKV
jgi:hypothetical protein